MNETGIVFFALSFRFHLSIDSFPQNFIGSELAGQPIRNSLTTDLVADTEFRNDDEFGIDLGVYPLLASRINSTTADVINESVNNRPYMSD